MKETAVHADPVKVCKFIRTIWTELDDDDQATFVEWVDHRNFGVPRMVEGLQEAEFRIGRATLEAHLSGQCCCPDGQPLKGARRATPES